MPQILPMLGSIALNAAIGIGASMLANAIRPQRANPQSATMTRGLQFELTLGEGVSVSAIWGRGRTAGQLTFAQEYGDTNQFMKFKIDCGYGWYDALETVIADEKAMTLTGSNADVHGKVVEQYRDPEGNPRMWIKAYNGAPGQAADAGLIAAAPTRWGVNHTATGRPYIVVTLHYHADLFPNSSLPKFSFVWRGLRLYDWRRDSTMPGGLGAHRWNDRSTWEWSDNPAVLAWNWRRGYWINGLKIMGMGFSQYANDLSYFTACANLCDEDLYFAETNRYLNRYAFGREIHDDEEHLAVLRQFEESWCGSSFDRGGAYAPVPAAAQVPLLTLEDRHRIEGATVRADKWGTVSSKKTNIHGTYASVSDLFVPAPYATRINVPLQALTRGPKAQKFDQLYEHTPERAQMRAEIALRRNLYGAVRTETFNPIANVLEPGDAVMRNCDWGPTLMIVDSVEPTPDGLGKVVTMVGWANEIVPDPDEGFIELPTAPGTSPVAPARTLQVSGLNIEPFQRVTGGNEEPFARATWSPITDVNCDRVIFKVWPDGTDAMETAQYFDADARLQSASIFGPLKPLTTYRRVGLLTRKDGLTTYPTTEGTFTTGAFAAPTTIPDDSVVIGKLVQELRNRMDLVVGDTLDRIVQLEREQEEQASAGFTQSATNKSRTTVLAAKLGTTIAAVIREIKARVEADSAMALALDQVLAQVDGLSASGMLRFESRVAGGGAEATIALMVRAGTADEFVDSGIYVKATKIPGGGTESQILFLTQKAYFTDGLNARQAITLDPTTGTIIFKEGRFEKLTSLDGTTIQMNGQPGSGFFSFGAS